MGLAHARLDRGHDVLDLARGEVVAEVDAEAGHHLARPDVHGEEAVRALDAGLGAHDRADGVRDPRVRGLADEQALALAGEEGGHEAEQDADRDRGHAVQDRTFQEVRRGRAGEGDQEADDGGAVLEEDHERRGVLAPPRRLQERARPFSRRNSSRATFQDAPSNTRASASTT